MNDVAEHELCYQYKKYVAAKLMQSGAKDIKIIPDGEDFGADIIAVSNKGVKVCVRCCYSVTDEPLRKEEIDIVRSAMKYHGCEAAMIVSNAFFTDKAIEEAKKQKVTLKSFVELSDADGAKRKYMKTVENDDREKEKNANLWGIRILLFVIAVMLFLLIFGRWEWTITIG